MNLENKILSDITVFSKYARFDKDIGRRETWEEICIRNADMHARKYPALAEKIYQVFREYVMTKKVLPSMRSMQFGGKAIERNPARIYNCAYLPVEHPDAFSETMFLLLGGTGVGYSVQYRHVDILPVVIGHNARSRRYVIGDSIEGWGDAVKVLVEAYFYGKARPNFDFGDIRDKGTELVTSGGKAPGPDPLRVCLAQLEAILHGAIGRKLKSIEAHDMQCFLADAVLAGGIRRAAMIALFSPEDDEMMVAKSGDWYELNPQRGRANNSVILLRGAVDKGQFDRIWERVRASGAGEPGIYWTNNLDCGTNPCAEISLRPYSFCNLTEINGAIITSHEDLVGASIAGAFIGTLQAGYTDFHYLRPIWRQTTEEDALIGVGITGIGANTIDPKWLTIAANYVKRMNKETADRIGINAAARTTTIKPSGTSSLVLGSPSGIHAAFADFYIRRMRFGKDEAIWQYLSKIVPELCEDEFFKPHLQGVLSIPQRSSQGAIVRTESALELLERVRVYNQLWVKEGHNYGENNNNVSCTISIKESEWDVVGEWMWTNRSTYNGISVLPYDGGTYVQAPFTECTEEEYNTLMEKVRDIDLTQIVETNDTTNLMDQAACAGNGCEVV